MRRFLELDEGSRQLLTISGLPLIDGVFATMLVSGALAGLTSIVSIALTVFAGAGALAILFSHANNGREARQMVYNVSPFLLLGGFIVALIAPIFSQIFVLSRLEFVTGIVLLLIAGKLYGLNTAERINTSWVLIPGLILSIGSLQIAFSLQYMAPAMATVIGAIIFLLIFTFMNNIQMNLTYIRNGSALVLLTFAISMFGMNIPSSLGLTIFVGSFAGSVADPKLEDAYFLVNRYFKAFYHA